FHTARQRGQVNGEIRNQLESTVAPLSGIQDAGSRWLRTGREPSSFERRGRFYVRSFACSFLTALPSQHSAAWRVKSISKSEPSTSPCLSRSRRIVGSPWSPVSPARRLARYAAVRCCR